MCFSATASFASGAILTGAGSIALFRTARQNDRAFLPFAIVPVAFGLQQLCEGVVWHGMIHDRPDQVQSAALVFLFFALGFWPVYIPAVVAATTRGPARVVTLVFLAIGIALAAFLAGAVLSDPDQFLAVRLVKHHIQYDIEAVPLMRALPTGIVKLLYLFSVLVPLMISSDRRVSVFGVLITASVVFTQIAYEYAFTSVWCFFAAVLAVYLIAVSFRTPPITPTKPHPIPQPASNAR